MSISIKNFKVEYMTNPIGVNTFYPKFSWTIESDEQNVVQESYRIQVKRFIAEDVWDSGVVKSDKTLGIVYKGSKLMRDNQYYVTLTVKAAGKEATANATFRTHLIDYNPPHIQWIRPNVDELEYRFSPYFRREFALNSNEIAYATAYISSRGWYELYINGKKPDEKEVLAPAPHLRYDKSFLNAYDITDMLNTEGFNAIGVQLGNGYCDYYRRGYAYYGGKRFWALISIVFTDGSYQYVWTDENWKWSKSPVIIDHIYDGEWYDARLEQPGWNLPHFDDSAWENATFSSYHEVLEPSLVQPVRIIDTRPACEIRKIEDNKFIYDFKFNGSGFIKLTVKGEAGAEVSMLHAENVHPDGSLQTWTNRNAESIDRYILKGEGEEIYIPRFTYHCFRFAEITTKGNVEILNAEALVISTDMFTSSKFDCSSPMINRITENCVRTLKTNFMGWSTDTGVRDERTPCSMDNLVYAEYAFHNISGRNYYKKWLDSSPNTKGNPDWGAYDIVNAWFMYRYYGDIEHIKAHYADIRALANAVYYSFDEDWYLGFGDWTAPSATNEYKDSFSSVSETNFCMWCKEMQILIELAEAIGETDDIALYKERLETVKAAYFKKFYNPETHLFSEGKQTPNILPLVFGLVEGEEAEKVRAALIESIRTKDDSHFDTGIFGTRYIVEALSETEEGRDLVYDILHQTTYPSFGQQIVNRDATTIYEQWGTRLQGMMTCSHSMPTGIAVTFYTYFAGIKNMGDVYKKIRIEPKAPKALTHVNCTYETERGIIVSNWKRTDEGFKLHVEIPANCTAEVVLPNGETYNVGSGKYDF